MAKAESAVKGEWMACLESEVNPLGKAGSAGCVPTCPDLTLQLV
jgi:hypothetical protein